MEKQWHSYWFSTSFVSLHHAVMIVGGKMSSWKPPCHTASLSQGEDGGQKWVKQSRSRWWIFLIRKWSCWSLKEACCCLCPTRHVYCSDYRSSLTPGVSVYFWANSRSNNSRNISIFLQQKLSDFMAVLGAVKCFFNRFIPGIATSTATSLLLSSISPPPVKMCSL